VIERRREYKVPGCLDNPLSGSIEMTKRSRKTSSKNQRDGKTLSVEERKWTRWKIADPRKTELRVESERNNTNQRKVLRKDEGKDKSQLRRTETFQNREPGSDAALPLNREEQNETTR